MIASDHLAELTARGQYHFSTEEFARITGTPTNAARAALRRLREKGRIATPYRGFHVIVAPEYQGIGCLPADQFVGQLMEHLGHPYYFALLSAALYHGAAHQQPQVTQVMVQKNRPPISCGSVRVDFIARRNADRIPTDSFNTPRGSVMVSSTAATAFDLVGYPMHAGGLDNVATVLAELSPRIEAGDLTRVAELSPSSWTQRLGYLFALVDAHEHAALLAQRVAEHPHETTALDPRLPSSGDTRDSRWKLLINTVVEPEL